MKRGILVAAMMVTAAGVASANLLTTASQSAAPPVPGAQPAAPASPVVARTIQSEPSPTVSLPVAAKVAAAPTVQKPSVEMRQAPVPLQVKPRPPVNVATVNAKATEAKPAEAKPAETKPGETPAEQPAADEAAGEKAAAKAAIEADGYRGVKVLRKGANGVWHASALRGQTTVTLTVDASGSVTAD